METIRNRAVEQFPTVLITLLSIVQALALEFLWDHLHHRPDLIELSLVALIGWIQVAASLTGIILIWLAYASMVMRFRWTPSTTDSVLPFLVGLIEFLMIDMMGPNKTGRWLLVLGAIFAIMIIGSPHVFRRARLDRANREFFDRFAPASARDFLVHSLAIGFIVLSGIWLWIDDGNSWVTLTIMILALALLVVEVRNTVKFWNQSMGIEQA